MIRFLSIIILSKITLIIIDVFLSDLCISYSFTHTFLNAQINMQTIHSSYLHHRYHAHAQRKIYFELYGCYLTAFIYPLLSKEIVIHWFLLFSSLIFYLNPFFQILLSILTSKPPCIDNTPANLYTIYGSFCIFWTLISCYLLQYEYTADDVIQNLPSLQAFFHNWLTQIQ